MITVCHPLDRREAWLMATRLRPVETTSSHAVPASHTLWVGCAVEAETIRRGVGHDQDDAAGGRMVAASHRCEICGGAPAVKLRFRWMIAVVIAMQVTSEDAHYCRLCALARHREFSERSLLLGWWGLQGIAVPLVVALNYSSARRAGQIEHPTVEEQTTKPLAGPSIAVNSRGVAVLLPPSLNLGPPLSQRWATCLFPAVLLCLCRGTDRGQLVSRAVAHHTGAAANSARALTSTASSS